MLPSRKRKIVYSEYDENAPVLSPLPIPNCECGIPAEVKQSRHPKTAARAYYTCSREWSVTMCFGCPITCNQFALLSTTSHNKTTTHSIKYDYKISEDHTRYKLSTITSAILIERLQCTRRAHYMTIKQAHILRTVTCADLMK